MDDDDKTWIFHITDDPEVLVAGIVNANGDLEASVYFRRADAPDKPAATVAPAVTPAPAVTEAPVAPATPEPTPTPAVTLEPAKPEPTAAPAPVATEPPANPSFPGMMPVKTPVPAPVTSAPVSTAIPMPVLPTPIIPSVTIPTVPTPVVPSVQPVPPTPVVPSVKPVPPTPAVPTFPSMIGGSTKPAQTETSPAAAYFGTYVAYKDVLASGREIDVSSFGHQVTITANGATAVVFGNSVPLSYKVADDGLTADLSALKLDNYASCKVTLEGTDLVIAISNASGRVVETLYLRKTE